MMIKLISFFKFVFLACLICGVSCQLGSEAVTTTTSSKDASSATINPITYIQNGYTITGSFEYSSGLSSEIEWSIQPLTGQYNNQGVLVTSATTTSAQQSASSTGTSATKTSGFVTASSSINQNKNSGDSIYLQTKTLTWLLICLTAFVDLILL